MLLCALGLITWVHGADGWTGVEVEKQSLFPEPLAEPSLKWE